MSAPTGAAPPPRAARPATATPPLSTPSSPAGATAACASSSSPPARPHEVVSGPDELLVLPLAGGCSVECEGERFELTRTRRRVRRSDRLRVRARATPSPWCAASAAAASPCRRPAPSAGCRSATARSTVCRSSCAEPALLAPGQQLLHARGVRGRRADRLRGAHPRRQLVVVPAAQARHRRAGRGRARGDLLLRGRPGARRPGVAYQRVYGDAGPADRRPGRGPDRRRRPHPARLARAVDGRARVRPVLPQRHGRARAPSAAGRSATTPRTPGCATPGTASRSTPGYRSPRCEPGRRRGPSGARLDDEDGHVGLQDERLRHAAEQGLADG